MPRMTFNPLSGKFDILASTKSDVGLGNLDNVQQLPMSYLDTTTTLGTSDTKVPSQNAVKVYADNVLGSANALVYKGVIDCSTNPNYPAADAGFLYIVSVAGKIGGASGISVDVGDMAICNTDSTASGDQATVGTKWNVIEKNIVGAVTGPGSATDGNLALFDGVTGKVIKDGGAIPTGNATHTGDVTGATALTIANKVTMTATAPVAVSGTPTVIAASPVAISMAAASDGVNGYMTGTYATKLDGIASAATANAKISAATLDTGSDDTGFVTALSIANSHNVPHVVPSTSGNVLTSDGTDWTSAAPPAASAWAALGACTYEAADAPVYTISFASDMTATINAGMRIKLTDSTVKYFIIHAVGAYSGGKTIITVYGGTDYTLSGGAITSPYYSSMKAPIGFPLDPTKWTVKVTDTTQRSQASPTQSAYYNLGTFSISIPIGTWNVEYVVLGQINKSGGGTFHVTLSTTNNSESDAEFGYEAAINIDWFEILYSRNKVLTLTSKTAYYLNTKTDTASVTTIYNRNDQGTAYIRAVDSYL